MAAVTGRKRKMVKELVDIVLQYDHLNSRGFNVSFADIRLGVILCQGHHAWKTFRAKKQYDIIVRQIIGPVRAALWDQVEQDSKPYPMSAWDWAKVEIALKQDLEKISSSLNRDADLQVPS